MRIFTQFIILFITMYSFCLAQWEQTGEINGISIYDYTDDGTNIYTGTFKGVFKSSNYGNEWVNVNSGQLDSLVPALINYENKIFASRYRIGLFVTTNAGASWTQITNGMTGQRILSFTRIENNIFAADETQGVFMSSDGGISWIKRNSGMGEDPPVSKLLSKDGNVFAGKQNRVYRSTNNGILWEMTSVGLPQAFIYSFGADENTIYAGINNDIGCYITTDNGGTWDQANTGLPAFPTIWSYANKNEFVFTGIAGHGVYVTSNSGINWNKINEGFTDVDIRSLYIKEPYIFAGNWGGKIWRRLLSEITKLDDERKEIPFNFTISQNYPNPFNPSTKISWQSPAGSWQTLRVYDVLGREVATLVDEEKPAGFYEVDFNAADLPSGIYYYQLKTGESSETKKMVLIR